MHRLRGKNLLKCDPANEAPADDALRTAIAIAQRQKARSLELRAALGLARLYLSARRFADPNALLVSALQGFAHSRIF